MATNAAAKRPRQQGVRPDEALTPARVVGAAIDLVERVGVDAFSVRALAKELGVYPTAIRHHVGDLRRLLGLVSAAWLAEVAPHADFDAPFEWLRAMAHAYRRAALARPNVASLVSSRLAAAAPDVAMAELIASHLEAAGLRAEELARAYNAAVSLTVGFVDLECAQRAAAAVDGAPAADAATGADLEESPTIARHADHLVDRAFWLRSAPTSVLSLDDSYDFLVDLVIDGLQRQVRTVSR